MNEIFKKRFVELDQIHPTFTYRDSSMGGKYASSAQWQGWATSVQNLIRAVYGEDTPHYINFREFYNKCRGNDYEIATMISLFRSAKEDFEGGYVFNVGLRVSGEVFGDFVVLARQSLSEGHKDVAAVLACAF